MASIEKDVSNEIELKNEKGNPFGWSQQEMWHDGKRIGWIESGAVDINAPGYRFTLTPEGEKKTRLAVYRAMDEDDWKATEFAKVFKREPYDK